MFVMFATQGMKIEINVIALVFAVAPAPVIVAVPAHVIAVVVVQGVD